MQNALFPFLIIAAVVVFLFRFVYFVVICVFYEPECNLTGKRNILLCTNMKKGCLFFQDVMHVLCFRNEKMHFNGAVKMSK